MKIQTHTHIQKHTVLMLRLNYVCTSPKEREIEKERVVFAYGSSSGFDSFLSENSLCAFLRENRVEMLLLFL